MSELPPRKLFVFTVFLVTLLSLLVFTGSFRSDTTRSVGNGGEVKEALHRLADLQTQLEKQHELRRARGVPSYKPQIRYEPTPWKRGDPVLPNNQSPLGIIRNNLVPPVSLPEDWDGGYGWKFVKYHPSPFELEWRKESFHVEKIVEGFPLCDLLKTRFKKEFDIYLSQLHRMPAQDGRNERCENGKFPNEPQVFDDHVFSKFEYVFNCTRPPCKSPPPLSPKIHEKKFSYIEPLVGLLRHPKACIDVNNVSVLTKRYQQQVVVDKNYMIIDAWPLVHNSRSTISPEPKVMYFDLGASRYTSGKGGSSQQWFHDVLQGKCLNITDWFMWEATKHNATGVFSQIPGYARPGYRWFNTFLQTDANSGDNPLNVLLVEAKKEDVVIFKIDFDSAKIELELIEEILEFPQVSELIDELFFEFHFNLEILRRHWRLPTTFPLWNSDALRLFTRLREIGLRSHAWV